MNFKLNLVPLAIVSAAMMVLTACGGGGSGGSTAPAASTPITTDVPVTVIDDAIGNATVCLDKNSNGVCDAGEPTGKTDAAGKVTLQVEPSDVGKFPILAVVGLDAVDAKYGKITTPFTMKAPADKTAVVSPLTTLVQSVVATAGISSTAAEASIRDQTGLNISLFDDFSKSTSPESQFAGTLARLVVVVTQQQSDALKSTLASTATDGTVVKQADLDTIVQNRLLEILPDVLTAIADPSVQAAATPELKAAALLTQANALVADSSTGLKPASVATLVAINNQTSPAGVSKATAVATAPTASGNLRALTFTDAANWFTRAFTSTAAQNTLDASGNGRYVDKRNSSASSAIASWNTGSSPARQADLHFNGSAWVNCGLNGESVSSARDSLGNSNYNFCDNAETGKSNRASFDVSGKTLASVVTDARSAGYTNLSIGDNSPAALSTALGSALFPAGSTLVYQASTSLTNAPTYYPGIGNLVTQFSPAVSNGGTASTQGAGVACNSAEFALGSTGTNSSTLESLMTSLTGTPCVFGRGSFTYNSAVYQSPDLADEAWGNSTVSLGTVGTGPVNSGSAPGFYTTNTVIRVAFKGTGVKPVTFYACKQRFSNGSSRNCTPIGAGSYEIASLGDARTLTFTGVPAQASPLTFNRVFVERGGKIYFGYQNKAGVFSSARLNLPAANALLAQLGIPAVDPNTPVALTRQSYAGDWDLVSPATPTKVTRIGILPNGTTVCTNIINGTPAVFACTVNLNPATGSLTYTDSLGAGSGTVNFLTGIATGSYTDTASSVVAAFSGARR